jgi:hypothetical protein
MVSMVRRVDVRVGVNDPDRCPRSGIGGLVSALLILRRHGGATEISRTAVVP